MVTFTQFIESKHLKYIQEWWDYFKWPADSIDFLPEYGIVALKDGSPVAACWLYRDKCKLCIAEGLICSPKVRREERNIIIDRLIQQCLDESKMFGFKIMYAAIGIPALEKRLEEKFGFTGVGRKLNMFKEL